MCSRGSDEESMRHNSRESERTPGIKLLVHMCLFQKLSEFRNHVSHLFWFCDLEPGHFRHGIETNTLHSNYSSSNVQLVRTTTKLMKSRLLEVFKIRFLNQTLSIHTISQRAVLLLWFPKN